MYEIHKLTGSWLIDAQGRMTGHESAGVISRHKSLSLACAKAREYGSDEYCRLKVEVRDSETGDVIDYAAQVYSSNSR